MKNIKAPPFVKTAEPRPRKQCHYNVTSERTRLTSAMRHPYCFYIQFF